MNTPNDDSTLPGRFMVLGKVGRGKGVHIKTMIAKAREWPDDRALAAVLEDARSVPRSDPRFPMQTPQQWLDGNPNRDRALWRRMVYLDAAMKGWRVIELFARDSRSGGQSSGVELTAGECFTVDSSRLSCGVPAKRSRLGEGI